MNPIWQYSMHREGRRHLHTMTSDFTPPLNVRIAMCSWINSIIDRDEWKGNYDTEEVVITFPTADLAVLFKLRWSA